MTGSPPKPSPPPPRAGSRSPRRASARRGRSARPGAHLGRNLARLALHQIDSVNVLARAHYLPAFSRLGAYDTRAARSRRLGPQARSGGCSNIGRTRPRCCRSRSIPCCAGGWRARTAARSAGPRCAPSPASAAPKPRRSSSVSAPKARSPPSDFEHGRSRSGWWEWGDDQARARMAVLGRPYHHRDPARQLRAGLRPDRAGDPARDPRPADAGAGRCAARPRRALGPRARHRHRHRSARLFPAQARRSAGPRSRLWSRRASCSPSRSQAGASRAFLHAEARRPRRIKRPGPARPVRSADLGARPRRAPVRFPLPDRNLHARAKSARTAITSCPS